MMQVLAAGGARHGISRTAQELTRHATYAAGAVAQGAVPEHGAVAIEALRT